MQFTKLDIIDLFIPDIASDMASCCGTLKKDTCLSPLWCEKIRELVTGSKLSDLQIHKLKANQLVPGKVVDCVLCSWMY